MFSDFSILNSNQEIHRERSFGGRRRSIVSGGKRTRVPLVVSGFLSCLLFFVSFSAQAARVTGIGRAPGDRINAREQALTDALRDAVRKGAGVDLISSTNISDFVLEYDRVFAAAFGHVKDYKVIEQYLDEAELYVVKVEATVEPGQPDMDDLLALKMIVRQKESPRVLIRTQETFSGLPKGTVMLEGMLRETALAAQMRVVNLDEVREASGRRARRDELVGNGTTSQARRLDVMQQYDFVIDAKLSGEVGNLEKLYGVESRAVSCGIDLTATWADTGETIAAVSLPSIRINSSMITPEQAMRDAVGRYLRGKIKGGATKKSGAMIFRRVIAHWITELDLGTKMRLEFDKITRAKYDQLLVNLRETEGISFAFGREFDSQLLSAIEVESRMTADQLKDQVLKQLNGSYSIDRYTRHFLQFRHQRAAGSSKPFVPGGDGADTPGSGNVHTTLEGESPLGRGTGAHGETVAAIASEKTSMPGWLWALIGAGAVGVLLGVFHLGKQSK